MLEIHVTIHCPELVEAAALLAKATTPATMPSSATASAPVAVAAPVAVTAPVVAAAPVAPAASPMPAAPLAQPPQFTLEQISRAGAELITKNPGILPQVNALLGQFGVQTLDKLQPGQMGPFATALRGLGAKL